MKKKKDSISSDLVQENRQLKEALALRKELYEIVLESSDNGVMLLDVETNRLIDVNEATLTIFGYDSKAELIQKSPPELSPEFQENGQSSYDKSYEMNRLAMEKGSHTFEWINLKKDGTPVYVDVILTPLFLRGKPILHVVSKDITARTLYEKELVKQKEILDYQAHHDPLTQLPNRLLFLDNLSFAIHKSKKLGTKLAIFFIDLDRFKQINDSLGHHVGDKVLQKIALVIKSVMREEDMLARFGGDEFTLLMETLDKPEDASMLAKKIIEAVREPVFVGKHKLYISASIGISLFPDDEVNNNKLLMYADSAMYKAKDEGRNNFQFYSSEMTKIARKRLEIESKLYKAMSKDEFIVYYQPQVDAKKKKIIGMEALIRWKTSKNELISPATFIPIAEDNGLIVPIDLWVMRTAMTQLASWYEEGLNPGVLAMNLSLKQLHQKDFILNLKALLEETKCKPEWLELEVTESSIMLHPKESIVLLNQISDMGIELAIDDFGTGYSSLSYLKRLPLDKLKIDKSFIDDLPDKEEDIGISRAIIALAKSLKLRVIAEGVETQEQLEFLLENGCENIQGYLFSKPLPAEAMREYLSRTLE